MEAQTRISRRGVYLSALELAVLKGIANGLQSKEIAAAIHRSAGTVELHVRILFAKFEARSRAHLVALALKTEVIQPHDIDTTTSSFGDYSLEQARLAPIQ